MVTKKKRDPQQLLCKDPESLFFRPSSLWENKLRRVFKLEFVISQIILQNKVGTRFAAGLLR
ncbi:hypothetical protein BGAL_0228g00210 [Botrytis galanthina]|uniref:Uncharacterized protein n=1 Tax=Botrytis galanthina TaxID=278940 RepID=A0A4S8QU21_9HELO|nr:hypothetical protein BGAL_0228g00210 [Botrytis galanthina]